MAARGTMRLPDEHLGASTSTVASRLPHLDLERQKIRHDIHHELAMIMLLASAVRSAPDVGPASQARADHLLGEARWLELLFHAYEDTTHTGASRWRVLAERVRLDTLAAEVLGAWQLTSRVGARAELAEAWAYVNRLMLWRALRNVMDNAYQAVGEVGLVRVRVGMEGYWSVIQVDDDGPGFGMEVSDLASLGLGIVHDFVTGSGGMVEMSSGELGGGCVRLLLPPSAPVTGTDGARPGV